MSDDLTREGTVLFWLRHHHPDWDTNRDGYKFPDFEHGPIKVCCRKTPQRQLSIEISGPFGNTYDFTEPIPRKSEKGVSVAIRWKDGSVTLNLQGQRAKVRYTP